MMWLPPSYRSSRQAPSFTTSGSRGTNACSALAQTDSRSRGLICRRTHVATPLHLTMHCTVTCHFHTPKNVDDAQTTGVSTGTESKDGCSCRLSNLVHLCRIGHSVRLRLCLRPSFGPAAQTMLWVWGANEFCLAKDLQHFGLRCAALFTCPPLWMDNHLRVGASFEKQKQTNSLI